MTKRTFKLFRKLYNFESLHFLPEYTTIPKPADQMYYLGLKILASKLLRDHIYRMREFSNLGLLLKNKRLERKLTQKEVGLSLGSVNTQFVSNWERGLCAPPSHSFEKLIVLLKIERETLVEVMLQDSFLLIQSKVYRKKSSKKKQA